MDDKALSTNLESWEQRVPIHMASAMYRGKIEQLAAGRATLSPPTDAEIGDVRGKRVLHLQCHVGLDSFSLALLGARVTGLDFSPKALAAARDLSRKLGLDVRFVQADAQRADEALAGERFDRVFASFGVFCWIPDLAAWFRSAARLLAPGGVLYVADFHPMLNVFDDDPTAPEGLAIRYDYFGGEELAFPPGPTYADDGRGRTVAATVEFNHPLSEFVCCVLDAGLRLDWLREFREMTYRHCSAMTQRPNGLWDFPPPLAGKLPMVFSLRATKDEKG